MSTYKVKTGHDNALNTLSDITPQPRTDATTQPVQRTDAASGAIHEQGLWIALQWSMIETANEYQTLLDQFGVGAALNADVTVYVPDFEYTFRRYNGVAVRPLQGETVRRTDYFIRDVTIIVKNLELLSDA